MPPNQPVPNQTLIVFDDGDVSYLRWLASNPEGYVLNTLRSKPATYMTLHRATCSSISEYHPNASSGAFTEREYIKVCTNELGALRTWVRQHGRPDGSFSSECGICQPLETRFDWD